MIEFSCQKILDFDPKLNFENPILTNFGAKIRNFLIFMAFEIQILRSNWVQKFKSTTM